MLVVNEMGIRHSSASSPITDSYFDAETTGRVFGVGSDDDGDGRRHQPTTTSSTPTRPTVCPARPPTELQASDLGLQRHLQKTGISDRWDNADDDDNYRDRLSDDFWEFGSSGNYPVLTNGRISATSVEPGPVTNLDSQ